MSSAITPTHPNPPQTGRAPKVELQGEDRGLWSQLLAAFRDLSGAFDPFANDAHPEVRALGRAVRQRRQPRSDDYFALGDMCARLTVQGNTLAGAYAAKTLAAYSRAGEVMPADARVARQALLQYAAWAADTARALGGYEAINVASLVCDRVSGMDVAMQGSVDAERLRRDMADLRERLERFFEGSSEPAETSHNVAERESRTLCDQGQMLLRQNQAVEALDCFERSLQADENNHAAWLWRAMALTDLGRFNDAIESYDRALQLEPNSAGVWNSKGALLLELGRLEPALDCFERSLVLAAEVSTVKAVYWLNKGKALYVLGRYAEARAALQASHQLDPSPESAAGINACDEQIANTSGGSTGKA